MFDMIWEKKVYFIKYKILIIQSTNNKYKVCNESRLTNHED